MSFDPWNRFLKVRESQSGSSLQNVRVYSFTLFYIPRNMRCVSRASFLGRTLVSPNLGCKPKVKVATIIMKKNLQKHMLNDVWTNYLCTYYYQFGKWQCLLYFNIQNSFVIMLFTLVHYVYVCKIMDGGCLMKAPFQPKHPCKHWIISWCVETLVCSQHKRL
jgi:hypothetical protein